MVKCYEDTNIKAIADAIRAKNGTNNTYKTSEMASAISKLNAVAQIPTFTIEGGVYQFEEGMTWSAWVNSAYNTGKFSIAEVSNSVQTVSGVTNRTATHYLARGLFLVFSIDKIISGFAYKLNVMGQ